jgi:catechol 2,3-dioxygenase-like lactoylglutathione lyase family enzyme
MPVCSGEYFEAIMDKEFKMHRGRLIDHVQIIVRDLGKTRRFYDAVFKALGVPLGGEGPEFFWYDEIFFSSTRFDPEASEPLGPIHLAFQAADHETVGRFHSAGLEAGGRDDGAPGERRYHPGYFAAFLLDPDGNYVEAVYHGAARRSAASVEIKLA